MVNVPWFTNTSGKNQGFGSPLVNTSGSRDVLVGCNLLYLPVGVCRAPAISNPEVRAWSTSSGTVVNFVTEGSEGRRILTISILEGTVYA